MLRHEVCGESAELAVALEVAVRYLRQNARTHAHFFADDFSVVEWEREFLVTEDAWQLSRDEQCKVFHLAGGRESGLSTASCRSNRNNAHAAELLGLMYFGGGPQDEVPSVWWEHLGTEVLCETRLGSSGSDPAIDIVISEDGRAAGSGVLDAQDLTLHGSSSRGHQHYLGAWRTGDLAGRPTRAGYWWVMADEDLQFVGAMIEFRVDATAAVAADPIPLTMVQSACHGR